MRTPLALLVGSLLVGCTVGDTGTGGGDDVGGAVCGDGVQEGNETCDDGNTAAGDGCSATCTVESNPSLQASLDKTSISTELGKTETVTLTLASIDGFSGDVMVSPSFLSGGVAIDGLTAQGPTSISVAAGASVPTQYTIAIPSNFTGADIAADLKFELSSSLGAQETASMLNVAAIYTVVYAAGTGTATGTHPGTNKAFTVKRGTKIRFTNADAITHITHGANGFPHENTNTGGTPNNTYEVNTVGTATGTTGTLGCHSHGDGTYATVTVE